MPRCSLCGITDKIFSEPELARRSFGDVAVGVAQRAWDRIIDKSSVPEMELRQCMEAEAKRGI